MINILKNNKVSTSFEKPKDYRSLLEQICKIYNASEDRVLIVWIEANSDKTFLERDLEYLYACEAEKEVNVETYLKPREWTASQIKMIKVGLVVVVIALHGLLNLGIGFIPILLSNLIFAVFEVGYFIVWDIQSLLYWAPFAIPFVYFFYLCSHWIKYVLKVKKVSKGRLFFFTFFGSNLIPNAIGFLSSMIGILWMVLAILNIALHKVRPLSSKDTNFIVILGIHLASSIARVIYFY